MIPAERQTMPVTNTMASRSCAAARGPDPRVDFGECVCIVPEEYQPAVAARAGACTIAAHLEIQPGRDACAFASGRCCQLRVFVEPICRRSSSPHPAAAVDQQ